MCTNRKFISAEGPARFRLLPSKPFCEVEASYFNPRQLTRNSESGAKDEAVVLGNGEVVRVIGRVVCDCNPKPG